MELKREDMIQVKIHERKGLNSSERSSWFGSLSIYTGAFFILLHGILHHSVRPIAQLTIGVCFVVEIFFLVKFLNKCLQFECTLNITRLLLERFFIATVITVFLVTLVALNINTIYYFIAPITFDEYLVIFSPAFCFLAFAVKSEKYKNKMKVIFGISLAICFAAYW